MAQVGAVHSIGWFPPIEARKPSAAAKTIGKRDSSYGRNDGPGADAAAEPPQRNSSILQVHSEARADAELIFKKLKDLDRHNVHGDLRVCLSAVKRLEEGIRILVGEEEGQ
jgi:hypothetical protein